MFISVPDEGNSYDEGEKIDIIYSYYRSPEDLKKIRFMGVKDIICPTSFPVDPTGASTYYDMYSWITKEEKKRCSELDLRLHAVLGIPPALNLQSRELSDMALTYLEDFIKSTHVVGIGEIGIGSGTKMEYKVFKNQLLLARKYNLPVLIQSPKDDKIAKVSLLLKEIKKSKVDRVIFTHADEEIIQLVLKDPNPLLKISIDVGRGGAAYGIKEAYRIYQQHPFPQRLILSSSLSRYEQSVYGLHETIVYFEKQSVRYNIIKKMVYENYIEIFPEISRKIKIST